jgi:Bax protein
MTKREVKLKFRTVLQTIGGVILICCALLTWGFFNQPTMEEAVNHEVVEIKEETAEFIDEVVADLEKFVDEENKLEPIKHVVKPDFEMNSNQTFLDSVNACIDYIYHNTTDVYPINRELLLAQAALESGWGTSRFATEGKNLFGMKTFDLREPHMLPSNKPKNWGVKVYEHECDSVQHYINVLNNGKNFTAYQELKYSGENDPIKLLHSLEGYADDEHYFEKVERVIKLIRKNYKLNYIKE